jgi:hypothetical protein
MALVSCTVLVGKVLPGAHICEQCAAQTSTRSAPGHTQVSDSHTTVTGSALPCAAVVSTSVGGLAAQTAWCSTSRMGMSLAEIPLLHPRRGAAAWRTWKVRMVLGDVCSPLSLGFSLMLASAAQSGRMKCWASQAVLGTAGAVRGLAAG